MSTISVGTIQSNTTSPPVIRNSSNTEIGTFCRAWVNFDGTGTVAIRQAFNVSSITDGGTGDYTVNFTNAMSDADYSVNISCAGTAAVLIPMLGDGQKSASITSSSFTFVVDNINAARNDITYGTVSVFR